MSEPSDRPQEKDERTAAVGNITALYADDNYITWWKGHMRLNIGERVGAGTRWRTAILMEVQDAERLAQNILNVLEKMKALTEKQQEKVQPPALGKAE